ncbi:MAG: sugar phosphate isomerase/epimerase [Acidobacteria bacterium]|nr:sugar phosphate isomerase/epimerase [Acidobacteriota bacterium]
MLDRRAFLATLSAAPALASSPPLKFGHRAASLKMVGDFDVVRVAAQVRGLSGIELQTAQGDPNLWDLDAVRRYKREGYRWGIAFPSISGIWGKGVSIRNSPVAGVQLLQSIRAAEILGSTVILVAFFRDNCPAMDDESQYGPVVELLQQAAPFARDAGVVLGLENSLNPADNAKLVDLVASPAVKVYYDLDNCEYYKHTGQAVPGIELLGRDRICQVHVKNETRLIEEPGRVDWRAAFAALKRIGYDGWYVFESSHASREQMIEATERNIAFIRQQLS